MLRTFSTLLLLTLLTAACAEAPPETAPASVYSSRAEVVSLPGANPVDAALYLRHEAVDDFRDFEDEVVGMPSMTMPFPVADSIDLSQIEVGDKVAFIFEVRWDGDPPYQVTALEELPADTELALAKP